MRQGILQPLTRRYALLLTMGMTIFFLLPSGKTPASRHPLFFCYTNFKDYSQLVTAERGGYFAALPRLGDGLVRSLAKIDATMSAPAALSEWRDFWTEAGTPYAELQIPLRIFSVGIEYLVKQDRNVLLDLVVAERQILEQTFDLE